MTLVCVGEGRGAHVALEGGVCLRTCCCFGRGWIGVFLALEVPGGAVVSVVCGGRGSLSYELQLWGGRIGFGHVRGSSGCLCIFFCPHLCYVCDDWVGGGCTLVLLFASCGIDEVVCLGPSACDADARGPVC